MKQIAIALILLICSNLASAENLTISWPKDYSVFQRNTTSTGGSTNVTFAGQFWNSSSATYRIEKLTATGSGNGDWQSTASLPSGSLTGLGSSASSHFFFTLSVPTGWYRFYISDGTNTTSIKFGVGEVFVIAGQSNAQGASTTLSIAGTTSLDCVVSNKNYLGSSLSSYYYLDTPTFGVLNSSNPTIGPRGDRPWYYQALGNQIAQKESGQVIPVCFFNIGHGGSSIDNWYDSMQRTKTMYSSNYGNIMVPGTTSTHQNSSGAPAYDNRFPYVDLKNVLSSYGNMFGVRAVIWHQGEAETKTLLNQYKSATYGVNPIPPGYSLDNYDSKLNSIIADTRTLLPGLPWAVSKVSLMSNARSGGTDYDIVNNSGNNLTTPSGNTAVGNTVTQEQTNVVNSTSNVSYASANSDSYTYAGSQRSDGTHFNNNGLIAISGDVYSNIASILSKSPVLPSTPSHMGLSQNTTESYTLVTGNYAQYAWERDSNTDMTFYQSYANQGNPWTSGISVDFTYKGWTKDFGGRISLTVPTVSVHHISGARMATASNDVIAYPNPSYESKDINISFNLIKSSPLKLQIVTEKGEVLEQIINPKLEAGKHNYSFPINKLRGDKNITFIIYKVKTLEHSESKKIMIVK